jgi:hypothetical protein
MEQISQARYKVKNLRLLHSKEVKTGWSQIWQNLPKAMAQEGGFVDDDDDDILWYMYYIQTGN